MPSTTYVVGVGIAKMISKYVKGINAYAASFSTDSYFADAYALKRMDLGMGSSSISFEQVYALGEWSGRGTAPVRQIAVGDIFYYGVIARVGSGIKTSADLKGKKFVILRPGSVLRRQVADAILHGYGFTENKDVMLPVAGSDEEIVQSIREGRVDAIGYPYLRSTPWLEELTAGGKAEIISDTPEALKRIVEKFPQFMPVTLPANTYKGQNQEVKTFGAYMTLDSRADLNADLVYAITVALFDNYKEWLSYHATIEGFRLPGSIEPIKTGIPIHEGTIRYYKEKGYWTADHEAKQKVLLEKLKGLGPFAPRK